MVNVSIESEITLTMEDDQVNLTGTPYSEGVTDTDNAMTYNVKTNTSGYNVSINSDSDTLTSSNQDNSESLDFSNIKAWNEDSGLGANTLSQSPFVLFESNERTPVQGVDLSTLFNADIPFVNSDDYTGTVTLTATGQ